MDWRVGYNTVYGPQQTCHLSAGLKYSNTAATIEDAESSQPVSSSGEDMAGIGVGKITSLPIPGHTGHGYGSKISHGSPGELEVAFACKATTIACLHEMGFENKGTIGATRGSTIPEVVHHR
jgi:hypothetical protein